MDNCPKEYKRGYTNFAKCKIDLSLRPMIPRRETEFLVKKAIKKIKGKNIKILDIFSGSGCIGITILKHIEDSKVDFAEIDVNLIKQIKINLELNKIKQNRYKVIQSNVFKNIKAGYDYIFANPPYISLKSKHLVQKSVLDYEPHLALFGGEDGLLYIRKFLKDARKHLKPDGKIYMEFDYLQKDCLEKLLEKLNYTNYKICEDQFEKWRWVCIQN